MVVRGGAGYNVVVLERNQIFGEGRPVPDEPGSRVSPPSDLYEARELQQGNHEGEGRRRGSRDLTELRLPSRADIEQTPWPSSIRGFANCLPQNTENK